MSTDNPIRARSALELVRLALEALYAQVDDVSGRDPGDIFKLASLQDKIHQGHVEYDKALREWMDEIRPGSFAREPMLNPSSPDLGFNR